MAGHFWAVGRSEGVVSEETVGSNQTEELTYRVFSQGKPGVRSTRIAKLCSNAVPDRHRDSVQWLRLRVCVLGGGREGEGEGVHFVVPFGPFPVGNSGCFPEKSQLRQSCATQLTRKFVTLMQWLSFLRRQRFAGVVRSETLHLQHTHVARVCGSPEGLDTENTTLSRRREGMGGGGEAYYPTVCNSKP